MGTMRCFECGQKEFFEFKEIEREYEGNGYHFTMSVNVPFCKKCGAFVRDEETENKIEERANKKIRESLGILHSEEIIEIVSQYNASQKFLSRMLGWGEITLTRYINNNFTPNRANSEKLKSIRDPYVLKRILDDRVEESEGEILKEIAFIKLRDSVNRQIENIKDREGRIFQIVNWFLAKATCENRMTHLALQKMLYFSQAWSNVFSDKLLFDEECEAWAHGAVYRKVYNKFKGFKYNPLPLVDIEVNLPAEEIEILEFVWKYYFEVYAPKTLEHICHLEMPYKLARENCKDLERCENMIDKSAVREYYMEVAQKYNISRDTKDNVRKYLNDILSS